MEKKIEAQEFIEWFEVHGNLYGTQKSQIQDIIQQGFIPLLDIDIQGAEKFVEAFPTSNTFFLFPPSLDELRMRLVKRGTETEESLQVRLASAEKEIQRALVKNDPMNLIGYKLINDNAETCLEKFV